MKKLIIIMFVVLGIASCDRQESDYHEVDIFREFEISEDFTVDNLLNDLNSFDGYNGIRYFIEAKSETNEYRLILVMNDNSEVFFKSCYINNKKVSLTKWSNEVINLYYATN